MDCSFLSQKERIALVTGGSRGIGKAVALAFADAGADVAITGRKPETLAEAAKEIESKGVRCLAVPAHLKKTEDLQTLVDSVLKEFERVDVLVNNAATNPAMGPIVDTEDDLFDHIIDTNLKGYFRLSKLVGKIMQKQQAGHIINISSAGGVSPSEGLGPYCISKAGINMLTKQMALELGPYNVRVNAIAPRIVKTDFSKALWNNEKLIEAEYKNTPLKCVGTPEEIAQSALYLASSASNYLTGHILVINGGAFL
ncbi:MAG: SDR family oxidoreductase [Desulfobacteraceae bacterium]|nr:SDR family oxidoreductase [Desulfobacteraceae bacterium]